MNGNKWIGISTYEPATVGEIIAYIRACTEAAKAYPIDGDSADVDWFMERAKKAASELESVIFGDSVEA